MKKTIVSFLKTSVHKAKMTKYASKIIRNPFSKKNLDTRIPNIYKYLLIHPLFVAIKTLLL